MLPNVAGDLPRRLASKRGLAELCADVGVPAPASARPKSVAELFEIVGTMGFPVVLKNDAAWERLSNPAVWCTTIVRDAPELERLASSWPSMPGVLVLFPASEQASAARLQSFLDAAESERVAAEDAATLRDAPAVVEETAR